MISEHAVSIFANEPDDLAMLQYYLALSTSSVAALFSGHLAHKSFEPFHRLTFDPKI